MAKQLRIHCTRFPNSKFPQPRSIEQIHRREWESWIVRLKAVGFFWFCWSFVAPISPKNSQKNLPLQDTHLSCNLPLQKNLSAPYKGMLLGCSLGLIQVHHRHLRQKYHTNPIPRKQGRKIFTTGGAPGRNSQVGGECHDLQMVSFGCHGIHLKQLQSFTVQMWWFSKSQVPASPLGRKIAGWRSGKSRRRQSPSEGNMSTCWPREHFTHDTWHMFVLNPLTKKSVCTTNSTETLQMAHLLMTFQISRPCKRVRGSYM